MLYLKLLITSQQQTPAPISSASYLSTPTIPTKPVDSKIKKLPKPQKPESDRQRRPYPILQSFAVLLGVRLYNIDWDKIRVTMTRSMLKSYLTEEYIDILSAKAQKELKKQVDDDSLPDVILWRRTSRMIKNHFYQKYFYNYRHYYNASSETIDHKKNDPKKVTKTAGPETELTPQSTAASLSQIGIFKYKHAPQIVQQSNNNATQNSFPPMSQY